MTDISLDMTTAIFAKTTLGQQEIQTRSQGLSPLMRRMLVLIDGRRSTGELATFVPGEDVDFLLQQLMAQGCIDTTGGAEDEAHEAPSDKPPTEARSAKENEMARNFMTNTVNTVFEKNTRLTLLEAIFSCRTTQDLRDVYPAWVQTMSSSRIGLMRLPELREKLFKVL